MPTTAGSRGDDRPDAQTMAMKCLLEREGTLAHDELSNGCG